MADTDTDFSGWTEIGKTRAVEAVPLSGDGAPSTYEPGRLYRLPLDGVQPDTEQPRRWFDPSAMEELAASVRAHGVLQPVLFLVDAQGRRVLVAGERRLHAARAAGLSLVENLLRADLTPVEEAEALGRLVHPMELAAERMVQGAVGPEAEDLQLLRDAWEDLRRRVESGIAAASAPGVGEVPEGE